MGDVLLLLFSAVLVNNFVLAESLGLCPLMSGTNKIESAISMALSTTIVLTLATVFNHLTYHYFLIPLDLAYLRTTSFMLVILAVLVFVEIVARMIYQRLSQLLSSYLPLIITNSSILGLALINIERGHTFFASLFYGLGASLGFSLVVVLFAALRERVAATDVPKPFRGAAINMIMAGLASLAFSGFTGLI